MICTLYSHYTGFGEILEVLKEVYPKGNVTTAIKEGFQFAEIKLNTEEGDKSAILEVSYRERKVPSYQLPQEDDSPLTTNLKGLWGFANSLPWKNEKVKELFLQKVSTLNCEFTFFQKQGKPNNVEELVKNMAGKFDAVFFVQPDAAISKSESQHFLDKDLNLIVDAEGNCEIDNLSVKVQSVYFDKPQKEVTEEQKTRKEKSEKIIKKKKLEVNSNLPCVQSGDDVKLRSPKEIAQRVTVLAMTNLVAFNALSGEEASNYLKSYNMWEFVTPKEKAFLENPTDEAKAMESWKCEGIWVLMWALKKVNKLDFPKELCDLNNIPQENYPVAPGKDPNDFIESVSETQTKQDILNANDLYYRLDWACVDARINNRDIVHVNSGVVYERHYALNWLINYMGQEWDEVSCDT